MNDILVSLFICFLLSGAGYFIALKTKKIKRDNYKNIAIWIFLGFVSFMLVFFLGVSPGKYWFTPEILVSTLFSYFMASSKFFDR